MVLNADMRQRTLELKTLVVEASRALASLDTDRLEELAQSCEALNRDLPTISSEERANLVCQARAAAGDLAVFGRVLEATQANLGVMHRLRELRLGRLEYGQRSTPRALPVGSLHGNH